MVQKAQLQGAGDGTAVPAGYVGEVIYQQNNTATSVGGTITDLVTVTLTAGYWSVSFTAALYVYDSTGTYVTQVFPTTGPSNAGIFFDSAHMTLKKADSIASYARQSQSMNTIITVASGLTQIVKLRYQDNSGTGTKNLWAQITAIRIA